MTASTYLVSLSYYTMHNTIWHFYINVLLSVSLIREFCTHSLYHVYGHLWTPVGGQKT